MTATYGQPRLGRGGTRHLPLVLLAAAALAAGCTDEESGPKVFQPGAPGEGGQVLEQGSGPVHTEPHTAADVRFVHDMIAHHGQALRLAALVPDRTDRADLALLARRVELSQESEIQQLENWLEQRGEAVEGGPHHHGGESMPGMLTEEQFAVLAGARGAEFDRLFLELMIFHHEGAVIMVEQLRSDGGAREPELFQLTNHIDIDQRIEIDRMRLLLADLAS